MGILLGLRRPHRPVRLAPRTAAEKGAGKHPSHIANLEQPKIYADTVTEFLLG
jgi:hypothetical protein